MKKNKKVLKKPIRIAISLILICIMAFSLYKIISIKSEEKKSIDLQKSTRLEIVNVEKKETYADKYKKLKEENDDFVGWVVFESGLIDLPFVKTSDNDYYLNKNFKKEYSSHGTIFQDYLQDLNGNNITLYGHYVYNNPDLMFTPIAKLKNRENYEENKTIYLYLEEEKWEYEVVGVIKYSVYDEPIYQYGNLDKSEFEKFQKYIYDNRLYDTGVSIDSSDKLLSLQTCVRNEDESRWLVISKLVKKEKI